MSFLYWRRGLAFNRYSGSCIYNIYSKINFNASGFALSDRSVIRSCNLSWICRFIKKSINTLQHFSQINCLKNAIFGKLNATRGGNAIVENNGRPPFFYNQIASEVSRNRRLNGKAINKDWAFCRNTWNHIAHTIYCIEAWAVALHCRSALFLQEARLKCNYLIFKTSLFFPALSPLSLNMLRRSIPRMMIWCKTSGASRRADIGMQVYYQ